jgi:hypothetical protein
MFNISKADFTCCHLMKIVKLKIFRLLGILELTIITNMVIIPVRMTNNEIIYYVNYLTFFTINSNLTLV